MPRTGWGWQITPEELRSWVLHDDGNFTALNKPAHVLCHRAKHGPWSSLISAFRELDHPECAHMPSRLDRETSGVVVIAKTRAAIRHLNRAGGRRQLHKVYHALLGGNLKAAVTVDQPIGLAGSAVAVRRQVRADGQPARTDFEPLAASDSLTFARITPFTGRTHQIRVHAAWLGHAVAGDKIYGPDERLFLEFLETGWTLAMAARLPLDRHALHASSFRCTDARIPLHFVAPLPPEWKAVAESGGLDWDVITRAAANLSAGTLCAGSVPPTGTTSPSGCE
jgi:23S rRNA pseudouridine1911/1915/1917 synthase